MDCLPTSTHRPAYGLFPHSRRTRGCDPPSTDLLHVPVGAASRSISLGYRMLSSMRVALYHLAYPTSSSYQCLETAKLPPERCSLDLRFRSCRSRCASGTCALRWVGHKHVRGVDALFRALPSGSTQPLTMRRCGSKHHHHHHHISSHLRSRARGTPCPRLLPPTLFPQSPRSAARHLHDRTTVNHSRLAARRMRYYTPRMN